MMLVHGTGRFSLLGRERMDASQLIDALVDEVEAADEQHETAYRYLKRMSAKLYGIDGEQRLRHRNEPGCETKEQAAHDHSAGKAQLAAEWLLFDGKTVCGYGYEDDIVHTEDNLEEDQRSQADPSFSCAKNRKIQ